jgi:serine-type D-Ala-D-Ala carboxypeptidase/endopeptidase (penicillin-binding protein 4)
MRKAGTVLAGLMILPLPALSVGGSAGMSLPPVHPPPPPLDPVLTSPVSSAAVHRLLAAAVKKPTLGTHVEAAVESLGDPKPLVRLGQRGPVTPASLLKLLTMSAALEVLGPGHRFTTSVVQGDRRSAVVLVGGGDPLLAVRRPTADAATTYPAPATLASLASQTARRLTRAGVVQVHLRYDASLFQGPAADPAWPRSYLRDNVVSRISSLWVNEGRASPGSVRRVAHPPRAAAVAFAQLLRKRGILVAGRVRRTRAAADAAVLARVLSPPLYQIVQHVISLSDNEAAEVLLRQAAIATGRPASFRGGVRTVRTTLRQLGLDLTAAKFSDGSGLARSDRLPIRLLLQVLQLAAQPQHAELNSLVSALPVAGFSGSLAYRFLHGADAGLGVVRAKTGTLTGVHGLAGILTSASGSALVFAVVADDAPRHHPLRAQAQLDRIAALLATCSCRRG